MEKRSLAEITALVVHCSDSTFGNAALIDKWHKERGWEGIGYHFVILNCYSSSKEHKEETPLASNDGEIEAGRPLDCVGAHAIGINQTSIGICLIGVNEFTGRQIDSLVAKILELEHSLGRKLRILGHREVNVGKTCPNISPDYLRNLMQTTRDAMNGERSNRKNPTIQLERE